MSSEAAVTQRFVYDGNAMIAEYNVTGAMLRRYVHGSNAEADDPLIWYEGATQTSTLRRYLHSDPRGSIVAVTNHTGNRIATNAYDEYGIPDSATRTDAASGGSTGIATKGRFRYTGQAWIPELGMYYYKARIYSPTLGRFLQTDPIGYEDQFNLYAYVGNDPINETDFTGREQDKDEDTFISVTDNSVRIGATTVTLNGNGVEVELEIGKQDFDNPATVTADASITDNGLDFGLAAKGTLGGLDVSAGIRSKSSRSVASADGTATVSSDGARIAGGLAKAEARVAVTGVDAQVREMAETAYAQVVDPVTSVGSTLAAGVTMLSDWWNGRRKR